MSELLHADGLKRSFGGNVAIGGVTVQLCAGQITGVVGPNGAGKTTLLNLLGGQLLPSAGTVMLGGRDVTGIRPSHPIRRRLMRSYQDGGNFGRLSALENVMVPLLARGVTPQIARCSATRALDALGLTPVNEERADRLSGGQRKLVDFARCMAVDADVVLLDEPTAGVHPTVAQRIARAIRGRLSAGTAFLIVSHDLHWVFELATSVMVLAGGVLVVEGPPDAARKNSRVKEAFMT